MRDQPALPEPPEDPESTPTGEPTARPGEPVDEPQTAAEPAETSLTVSGNMDADGGQTVSAAPVEDVESPGEELSTGALLANVALTQGLFGAVLAVGAWYYEIPWAALGLTETAVESSVLVVIVGLVFGVLLWIANEISATVADAVGAGYDESLREMLAPDTGPGWVLLLGVILPIIAIVEELLFRAALIGVPAAGFGIHPLALAIFSSALFAMGHGAQGRVGIAVTGGLGFVLAGGYILTGSLVVVVIAHYLVNALEFVVHEGVGADRLAV